MLCLQRSHFKACRSYLYTLVLTILLVFIKTNCFLIFTSLSFSASFPLFFIQMLNKLVRFVFVNCQHDTVQRERMLNLIVGFLFYNSCLKYAETRVPQIQTKTIIFIQNVHTDKNGVLL